MARDLITRHDMVRHTMGRAAIAFGLAMPVTAGLIVLKFGADFDERVSVGQVFWFGVLIAGVISICVTCGLTYRSAILMHDLATARAELLRLSRTDQLTGLLNRRGFDDLAGEALSKSGPIAVLMCDIDRFKGINDRYGHEFGDHVLIAIADVFRAFAQDEDALVARHGGEEFVLLLSGPAAATIKDRAEFLRHRCATTIKSGRVSVPITVSIGFALSTGGTDLKKLLRAADEALYLAKRGGRNRVVDADAAIFASHICDTSATSVSWRHHPRSGTAAANSPRVEIN